MRSAAFLTVVATVISLVCIETARSCGQPEDELDAAARDAVAADEEVSRAAIAQLRAAGPQGLEALLAAHRQVLKAGQTTAEFTAEDLAAWHRLRQAIDAVGAQRDCQASRLYWYTDLELAKAAARQRGLPILSLRLLGNLTDEYSCANSRFFRTTLYANREVSAYLKDHFVLHWKSVRPVPKVTIDFGDGRKLERTLTGNSIHYVLNSDGQPIDAIPGLYGPKAFLRVLRKAEQSAIAMQAAPVDERPAALAAYHREQAEAILAAWRADLAEVGSAQSGPQILAAAQVRAEQGPGAVEAARIAQPKFRAEAPILRSVAATTPNELSRAADDLTWAKVAELHAADSALDAASVALMRRERPDATEAGRLSATKRVVEDPLVRMVRSFQNSIALDTVRNEYLLHHTIHQWLIDEPLPDLDALNERIYAQLFLTPSSDPWLGLVPADTYTALENGGVIQ